MKKLYCKKAFHQFKPGDELPEMDALTQRQLLKTGMATGVKKRSAKKKTDAESK